MGKNQPKDQKGTGGGCSGGDLGQFLTQSLAAAQCRPESKMTLVPHFPARSDSALELLVSSHVCHAFPEGPD